LAAAVIANPDQLDVRLAFVLDDEARIGSVLCKMLAALGIEARQFVVAAEFLAELKTCNPDLVFLDLALGQTDAIDVIHELEACAFKGRVLLISGRDSSTLMEVERVGRAHGLAMLPPLPKPFQIDDIRDCLRPLPALQPELPEAEGPTGRKHPEHLGSKA
jgi:DNA-binding response OmpR family regulator